MGGWWWNNISVTFYALFSLYNFMFSLTISFCVSEVFTVWLFTFWGFMHTIPFYPSVSLKVLCCHARSSETISSFQIYSDFPYFASSSIRIFLLSGSVCLFICVNRNRNSMHFGLYHVNHREGIASSIQCGKRTFLVLLLLLHTTTILPVNRNHEKFI